MVCAETPTSMFLAKTDHGRDSIFQSNSFTALMMSKQKMVQQNAYLCNYDRICHNTCVLLNPCMLGSRFRMLAVILFQIFLFFYFYFTNAVCCCNRLNAISSKSTPQLTLLSLVRSSKGMCAVLCFTGQAPLVQFAAWVMKEFVFFSKPSDNGDACVQTTVSAATRDGDSSVVRVPDSWLKGHGFESLQERQENFLLQGRLSVLTLYFGIRSTPVLLQ